MSQRIEEKWKRGKKSPDVNSKKGVMTPQKQQSNPKKKMQEEIVHYPPGSEFGTRKIRYSEYCPKTERYKVIGTDIYIINKNGNTVPDYKQGDYPHRLMNDSGSPKTIAQAGCYISSISNVATYYGNVNDPRDVDTIADAGGYYAVGSAMLADPGKLINELGGIYSCITNANQFRLTIKERILQGKPTIIQVKKQDGTRSHFAVVRGAQCDAKGKITHYLLSDPGTRNSNLARISVNNLRYVRDPTRSMVRIILYDKK